MYAGNVNTDSASNVFTFPDSYVNSHHLQKPLRGLAAETNIVLY